MNNIIFIFAFGFMLVTASPTTSKLFASNLFYEIVKDKSNQNTVFSPISIETCLALTYLGAEGDTADEVKNVLHLTGHTKEAVAENFSKILSKNSDEVAKVKIVNSIYITEKLQIAPKFNELANKYFGSTAENLNFGDSAKSAEKINSWIENQTENKIKNLLDSNSLDDDTAAVLVNAIYFKANWTNSFESLLTQKQDFVVSEARKVPVDMMYQSDYFLYGDLNELDAKVVELSYEGTDISMIILLPNKLDSLASLESKFASKEIDLLKLSDNLKREKVELSIPKFKIEFDLSLQPVLEQLGIKTMFTPKANFKSLLASDASVTVSEVKHKAFIEVNEMGTEAAAATYVKVQLESLIIGESVYDFKADHPFLFVIKDSEHVYFAGHVVDF